MKIIHSLHRHLAQVRANQQGGVLIMVGVGLVTLFVAAGSGYDLGRQQLVRMKLQQASDAAALAGALLPDGTSVADRTAEAVRFFDLNFPQNYLGQARPTLGAGLTVSVNNTVQVTATRTVPTSFVSLVGINTLASTGASTTVLKNVAIDYDVVMVIDESGSMNAGTRVTEEKNALLALVDAVLPVGSTNPNVRVGMVGYTQYMVDKWGLTSDRAQVINAINGIRPVNANYDHWGLEAGYNMITGNTNATVPNGKVLPPSPKIYDCNGGVGAQILSPGTLPAGHQCLVQNNVGWPTCAFPSGAIQCDETVMSDPVKNTKVPPPQTARGDGEAVSPVKNVVFLTDGFIMVEPPPCQPFYYNGCQNYPAFLAECTKLKNDGVTVFTISFTSQTAGDAATLKSCASIDPQTGQPRYYYAPTGASLLAALHNIGVTISKVRIFQ